MVELVTVNKSANGRYYGRWEQRYDYTHFIVRSDDPLPSQKLYTEKFSDAPSGKPSPAPGVYPSPLVVVHSLVVYVDSKKKMICSQAHFWVEKCVLKALSREKLMVHPNRVSSNFLIPNG